MDPILQQIAVYAVTFVIFIIIAYVGYRILLTTSVGKGLNQFMGGVGAVLGGIGAQLDTCATKGFFSSGCYLGWGGIAIGCAWAVASLGSFFKINDRLSDYFARTGNNTADVARTLGKDFNKIWDQIQSKITSDGEAAGLSTEQILARLNAAEGILPNELFNRINLNSIKNDPNSPASKKAEETANENQARDAKNSDAGEKAGLNENDTNDVAKTVNEIVGE